jgi:glycosyltransferase involved in cell wall biosynthesis
MRQSPFFTIIVPTFNQAQFLGAALDSILAQTDLDWEAVVINDGSTDDTPEIMEKYAKMDSRIRIFHKSNGGVASALNWGLRQALGQWVCWLSSDDMFDPRKLQIHRDWIERYPDCRFFFTYFRPLREVTGEVTDHDLWGPLPAREFQLLGLFYRNYISGISICINRLAWDQMGFFDESLKYAQDFDMWLRLLSIYPAVFIPEWTCINRNHALQGSEVFPQACYYDTAKAIIRFINNHSFEKLFPLIDFGNRQMVLAAVRETLDVSAAPSGFIYSLGPHPALLFRLLEWLWSMEHDIGLYRELQEIILQRALSVIRQHDGTFFGFFWKAVAAAIQLPKPQALGYNPLSPSRIGEAYYYVNQPAQRSELIPLQKYLRDFDNVQVREPAESSRQHEVVVVLPSEILLANNGEEILGGVLGSMKYLLHRGCRILLLGHSKQRLGMIEGIMFLGAEDDHWLEKMVASLKTIDTLITTSRSHRFRGVKAKRKVVFEMPVHAAFDENLKGQELFHLIETTRVQRDYFQILEFFVNGVSRRLKKCILWISNRLNKLILHMKS